jgi:photosystem II stability/assembly factor-like uncharacterized protein
MRGTAQQGDRVVAVGVLAVVLGAASLIGTLSGAAVPRASWEVRGAFPSVRAEVGKVVCPSTSLCVAIPTPDRPFTPLRPEVLRTGDGGRTWLPAHVPPGRQMVLLDLSCPTTNRCVAVGESPSTSTLSLLRSSDGARTWTVRWVDLVKTLGTIGSATVSCMDADHCVAFASEGNTGGLTLAPGRPSPPASPPVEFTTGDGGASWSRSSPLHSLGEAWVAGVSCGASATCEAVGTSAHGDWTAHTADGGESWSVTRLPKGDNDPTAISCGTASFCVALSGQGIGTTEYRTLDGGRTWRTASIRAHFALPSAIDCQASGRCVVGGYWVPSATSTVGLLEVSSDHGATWRRLSLPTSSGGIDGVACATDVTCVLLGYAIGEIDAAGDVPQVVLLHGGRSSLVATSIDRWFDPKGLVCASASRCVAVGGAASASGERAAALTTSDAGRTWSSVLPVPAVSGLRAVACPSAARCVAVGWEETRTVNGLIMATSDGGRSWQVVERVAGLDNTLADVACPTRSTCLAVGVPGSVLRSTDGGLRWSRIALPDGEAQLSRLSCTAPTACVAEGRNLQNFGGVSLVTRDGGLTWSASTYGWLRGARAEEATSMDGLACASSTRCLAVSYSPAGHWTWVEVTGDGGASWSRAGSPRGVRSLTSVSCRDPEFCVAIGATTHAALVVTRDAGRSWSVESAPAGLASLLGVWCSTAGCWVAGSQGSSGDTELTRSS